LLKILANDGIKYQYKKEIIMKTDFIQKVLPIILRRSIDAYKYDGYQSDEELINRSCVNISKQLSEKILKDNKEIMVAKEKDEEYSIYDPCCQSKDQSLWGNLETDSEQTLSFHKIRNIDDLNNVKNNIIDETYRKNLIKMLKLPKQSSLAQSVRHLLNQLITETFQSKVNMSGRANHIKLSPLNEIILEKLSPYDENAVNQAIRYALHLTKNRKPSSDTIF